MCQHLGWLVNQIPPGLSPTYTGTSKNVSVPGFAGAQTRLQFCRLPVRPQLWSGLTDSGLVAEPSRENAETAIPTGLPGPGIHRSLIGVLTATEKQVHLG